MPLYKLIVLFHLKECLLYRSPPLYGEILERQVSKVTGENDC